MAEYTAAAIRDRMMDTLREPGNRIEGGFCMDNLQAVAEELARIYQMEVLTILDRYSIDTAEGADLDRKAQDFGETRKEAESDESFRSRLLEKIQKPVLGGNENHYVYWGKQVPGVGNVRCVGCWDGPGTVKVVVLSDTGGVPGDSVLQAVREHIAPLRPIGADVTVTAASPLQITVDATVDITPGTNLDDVETAIYGALNDYLTGIAYTDKLTVSYHKIGELMFHIDGIDNVVSYTINGADDSITLTTDQFAALQEVTVHAAD